MYYIEQEDKGIIFSCYCGNKEIDEEATNKFWDEVDKERIKENPLWLKELEVSGNSSHN